MFSRHAIAASSACTSRAVEAARSAGPLRHARAAEQAGVRRPRRAPAQAVLNRARHAFDHGPDPDARRLERPLAARLARLRRPTRPPPQLRERLRRRPPARLLSRSSAAVGPSSRAVFTSASIDGVERDARVEERRTGSSSAFATFPRAKLHARPGRPARQRNEERRGPPARILRARAPRRRPRRRAGPPQDVEPRPDRLEDRRRIPRRREDQRPVRRLLEELEQRVPRLLVHGVEAAEHDDARIAEARPCSAQDSSSRRTRRIGMNRSSRSGSTWISPGWVPDR